MAEHLSRHGIAVLRHNDRGTGDSAGQDKCQYSGEDLVGDTLAAVTHGHIIP